MTHTIQLVCRVGKKSDFHFFSTAVISLPSSSVMTVKKAVYQYHPYQAMDSSWLVDQIRQSSKHIPDKTIGAKANWSSPTLVAVNAILLLILIDSNVLNQTVTAGAKIPPPHKTMRLLHQY